MKIYLQILGVKTEARPQLNEAEKCKWWKVSTADCFKSPPWLQHHRGKRAAFDSIYTEDRQARYTSPVRFRPLTQGFHNRKKGLKMCPFSAAADPSPPQGPQNASVGPGFAEDVKRHCLSDLA